MDNPLLIVQQLFRTLAEHIREAVNSQSEADGWTVATFDIRFAPEGSPRAARLDAMVGGRNVSLDTIYAAIDELAKQIWERQIGEPFYGFALSLLSTGQVDVQLNYDVNCLGDQAFWK
jgi:hypothetical protein